MHNLSALYYYSLMLKKRKKYMSYLVIQV